MKTVVIFSGGLDSTVLLHYCMSKGDEVLAISFNYRQRHKKELEYAQRITSQLGVEYFPADLSPIASLLAGSSQTSEDIPVPHGHYADPIMKSTVIPNRNMIMIAIAGAWAISRKCHRVAFGAHSGDHAIYPDCRTEFTVRLGMALEHSVEHGPQLYVPFSTMTKKDIVKTGHCLGLDLANTWSCYEGKEFHCGECGTCVERREAFKLAGIVDPTTYKA